VKRLTVLIYGLIVLLAVSGSPVSLQAGDAGQTAAEVLRLGAGAHRPALGGAGVAAVTGPASLQYNPAGLAFSEHRELEFTYQSLVEDIQHGNLDATLSPGPGDQSVLAGGLRYVQYGDEDRTEVDDDGEVKPNGSFGGMDAVASIGLGSRVYENTSIGFTGKLLYLEIDDETANAIALDAGMRWNSPNKDFPLSLGLVLANLGTDVEFDEDGDDLPLTARAGASLGLNKLIGLPVNLHLDAEHQIESGETGILTGLEVAVIERLALRGGYNGNLDVDSGFTAGLGAKIMDGMNLDYAFVPYGDFGTQHRIAFRYHFGGI